ncbi:hypothetical protein RND71_043869 [Anisodus tanguticus]|uniref:CRC domain-containing protein n=1 Tax=Anisodus tanguticus TaxID=243964 RepID=A0AAE1QRH4_9SOLA|nr:hypothetical protein RND71_043869 [Anisodus tanguticus]
MQSKEGVSESDISICSKFNLGLSESSNDNSYKKEFKNKILNSSTCHNFSLFDESSSFDDVQKLCKNKSESENSDLINCMARIFAEDIIEEINLNEEIVFDEVVNEVSIVDDEQNRNQNLIVQTSSPSIDNNLNQFIQTSIKSPVNNTGQVTSIKNVTPNFKNKQSSLTSNNQSKLVNNIVITPKTSPQVKKASSNTKNVTIQNKPTTPTTINISPSSGISLQNNQILTKVIMTTGGQQLLITSPIKGHTRTENSNNLSNQTPERQLMAILPVSPNKQQSKLNTSTSSSTNVSIRPKPANITISSPSLNQSSDSKPQYQIIRLVTATTNGNGNSTVNTISTSGLKQIGQNIPGQQHKVLIPASALKNLNASQLLSTSGSTSQLVMYAPTVVQPSSISTPTTPKTVTFSTANVQPIAGGISSSNLQQRHSYVPILPNPSTVISNSASKTINQAVNQKSIQNGSKNGEESIQIASTSTINSGPSSNRPRKPCNCTRSQCLKLYCDCFANGEFCSNCNCINCSNNLDHEENRQKAIKQCLERNPHAFHPKIGKGKTTAQEGIERRHTKGCNCRRSGLLAMKNQNLNLNHFEEDNENENTFVHMYQMNLDDEGEPTDGPLRCIRKTIINNSENDSSKIQPTSSNSIVQGPPNAVRQQFTNDCPKAETAYELLLQQQQLYLQLELEMQQKQLSTQQRKVSFKLDFAPVVELIVRS